MGEDGTAASRKKEFLDSIGAHAPGRLYFHATSAERAEKISKEGFSLDHEVNGRSAGDGVYLHSDPREVAQYGEHIVAVKLAKGTVVPSVYDAEDRGWHAMRDRSGIPYEERRRKALEDYDYHADRDPDDKSVIVFDPSRVKPVVSGPAPRQWREHWRNQGVIQ